MTAVYQDADGYTHTDHYTQDDIPADQAPVLEATVTAIASMGEDWQASQVWAQLGDDSVINNPAARWGPRVQTACTRRVCKCAGRRHY